ncbi:MAG TPA: HDIG domain-containing protein [Planctomycetota bacterium]|nr:HDIG domain-containing protein [Planctomycetota bacterium]
MARPNGRAHRPRPEEIVRRSAAPAPAISSGPALSRSQKVTLILFGALFVVGALAILNRGAPPVGMHLGEKAQANYMARVDFVDDDPRAYNDRRKAAMAGTPGVYFLEPKWSVLVMEDLEKLAEVRAKAKDLEEFRKAAVEAKVADEQSAEPLWKALENFNLREDLLAPLAQDLGRIQHAGVLREERQRAELERRPDIRIEVRSRAHPGERSGTLPASRCYSVSTATTEIEKALRPLLRGRPPILLETAKALLARRLQPSLDHDPTLSEEALKKALGEIDVTSGRRSVRKGEVLLLAGDRIEEQELRLLRVENAAYWESVAVRERLLRTGGLLLIVAALFCVAFAWIVRVEPEVLRRPRALAVLGFLAAGVLLAARFVAENDWPVLMAPAVFFAMAAALVLSVRTAAALSVLVCALAALAAGGGLYGAAALTAGSLAAALACSRPRHHLDLLRAALAAGLVTAAVAAAGRILSGAPETGIVLREALWGLLAALGQGLVLAGALPVLEAAFGVSTSVSLRVLCDPNQSPVLRTLFLNAPNSFHHCSVVGMLAENAAAAVGASPLLARAGGYYHDIGKLARPEYFVENAPPGENRHDRMAPAMSATVVIAHVRDGVELARSFRLPRVLVDIIEQHHGTTRAEYFYRRALDRGEEPAESIFRYPGPRPQSKEAAVILLADAVEAASRTLEDPSAARIEAMVRDISRRRLLEGQFDECGLTLRELGAIEATLTRILLSMFHARIAYPADRPAAGNGHGGHGANGNGNGAGKG